MTTVTLDNAQRCYMLTSADGDASMSFEAVYDRLKQCAKLLGRPEPDVADIGTYFQYLQFLDAEIGILTRYVQYLEAERAHIATKLWESGDLPADPRAHQYTLIGVTEAGRQQLLHVTAPHPRRRGRVRHSFKALPDVQCSPRTCTSRVQ
jgi:hypothetical protein